MSDAAKGSTAVAEPAASDKAGKGKPANAKAKPEPADGDKGKGGKKKGFNIVLLLVPIALVAALVLAFTLPPTHAMIVNGPLKPLLARFGLAPPPGSPKAQPSADPAAEVKRLGEELAAQKRDAAQKDAQIGQLQSQVTALQAKPSPSPSPAGPATPAAIPQDVKRAADVWANMDPDKVAEIAVKLPDPYVRLVFSQMAPDAVADILSALPVKTAVRLTANPAGPRTPAGAP